jgi:hypothetical protein
MTGPVKPVETPKADPGKAPAPQRPEWLDPKFKTPEDMAKAYAELQRAYSKARAQELGEKPPEEPKAAAAKPAAEAPKPATPEAEKPKAPEGVSQTIFDKASKEYEEGGTLSEETYTELSKTGITREMADVYIAGQKAIVERNTKMVLDVVGGEKENLDSMLKWMVETLPPAEVEAYNEQAGGKDINKTVAAVKGAWARYVQANGHEPKSLRLTPATPEGDTYGSIRELMADINDKRYQKGDTAFIARVEAKLARSGKLR